MLQCPTKSFFKTNYIAFFHKVYVFYFNFNIFCVLKIKHVLSVKRNYSSGGRIKIKATSSFSAFVSGTVIKCFWLDNLFFINCIYILAISGILHVLQLILLLLTPLLNYVFVCFLYGRNHKALYKFCYSRSSFPHTVTQLCSLTLCSQRIFKS